MKLEALQGFQLSPQQKRLWLSQQNGNIYLSQAIVEITGKVDLTILQEAFQKILDRQEILRTNFYQQSGISIPFQVIAEKNKSLWQTVEFKNLSEKEIRAKLLELLQSEKFTKFNLAGDSLLRLLLIISDDNCQYLMITLPSLCADSRTINNLVRELSQSYSFCLQGKDFVEEPVQYIQFSEWQNELLTDESESGRDYWQQQQLEYQKLILPNELNSKLDLEFKPNTYSVKLRNELINRINLIATQYNSNLANLLLACWYILIYKLTNRSEIAIANLFTGRKYEELNSTFGLLDQFFPVGCIVSKQFSFSEILSSLENNLYQVKQYQEHYLRENSEREAQNYLTPLIGFEFERLSQKYDADGISFSVYKKDIQLENFKLKLTCQQQKDCLVTEFNYDTNKYYSETITLLAQQFRTLLESVVDNPEATVGELNILDRQQRHQLIVEFNNNTNDYPQDRCIHQLFEAQVVKTPNNIAVVCDSEQLTYSELNSKADVLANYLKQLGVKPETLVGLYLDRSHLSIIGLLGILKAGAAYLPLDSTLPKEGLAFRLQDAGVSVLLTQRSLLSKIPANIEYTLCLDTDRETIEENQGSSHSIVQPDSLVYAIYTSGSTGKPKAVAIEQRQLVNYVRSITEKLDISSDANFAIVSTLAADLGNTMLFPALCTGGCLHLISQETATDSQAFSNYCQHHPIDYLKIVPSHLSALLFSSSEVKFLPRKKLILGGEASNWRLIEKIQQQQPDCKILNHYGPTETTVGVLTYQIDSKNNSNSQLTTVPVGKPLPNTQVYVLDEQLQPVPLGVIGELYVGGAQVCRGYLNRPELNNQKFITNSFSDRLTARLYKTGDLGRYLSNGELEYIGRIDHQVKIRGFRIELGEIEAQIAQHPAIRETVVVVKKESTNYKHLVAYVVAQNEQALTISTLREFLEPKLPNHMIPSAFVTLEALPLTPNGKVNRKALPARDREIIREQEYVAPRTVIEETLTNIWQELLLREKVSIHDNFFEIGGDSILSIQVISRAKNSGMQITTQQIFEYQTIAELARVVNSTADSTVSINAQQGIVTGVAPLTPIQHRFFAQNRQEIHHFNQSVLLNLPNDIKPELLKKAVEKLLEHHDALRLRFKSQASEYKQINCDQDNNVPFSVVDLSSTSRLSQPQTLSKIATECQSSLNLSTAPIMRVVLFNLGSDDDARLLIVIHHLAVDGVSWRILLPDLQTIYQQLIAQEPIQLNAKTTAFIDWAKKINNYAQSEILKQELDYWLNQPWSKITPLPLDYACTQGENTVSSAASVSVELSVEETQTLLKSVNEAYSTQINDILLSALALSLAQWTKNSTVVINLEGHGREELFDSVDLSRTVGWFTSFFPVLLQLTDIDKISSVIKSIKEQLRAIPNRGVGYGILRYLCKDVTVERQLQAIPNPGINFNYLGQFDQVESQGNWKFASESAGANQSLKQIRNHLLDVHALVLKGKLQINFTYSSNFYTQATLKNLAQSYIQAIKSIIKHCQSKDNFGYTPSDFPDIQLNQLELDELLENLHE